LGQYCGVVVLYNPDKDIVDNINTYINELAKLYIIDNSRQSNELLVDEIKNYSKVDYCFLGGNLGLAYALNIGCEKALIDGYDYILTMDQDSKFLEGSVKEMINFIENSNEEYAIVAPNVKSIYIDEESKEEKVAYTILNESDDNRIINWVMTSGSMMNLKDYNSVNGFDNDMFIAHVDIDLCIKFNLNKRKIIQLRDAIILQRFGNSIPKKILWKTVHPSFADPVRTYYLFRNQKYLEIKYSKKVKRFIGVDLYKFIIKILLFEPQKLKKLKMGIKGLYDAQIGRMGPFSN
jgi:rhamnosyltransferase